MSSDERVPYSRRADRRRWQPWPRGGRCARVRAEFEGARSRNKTRRRRLKACRIREANIPKPPFRRQQQPWPGLASRMDPRPDHGETSYRGSGRLAGRKALITGGDSGMGRAAAIAFAREGADVAINHLPAEEEDAREVIELMKAEGRTALSIPGDIRDEAFCKRLVDQAVAGPRRPRYPRQQRGAPAEPGVDPRYFDRGFRRDDEDEHLCAVLDHQGGAAAHAARARPSSAQRRSRLMILRPTFTTMRRPRPRP